MSRETQVKKTISDDYSEPHTYVVQMMPAGQGFRLMVRLLRIIGGMLGRAWGSLSPSDIGEKVTEVATMLDAGIDGEGIAKAVERLAEQIIQEGSDAFVKEILGHTYRDGKAISECFEHAFMGNYGELFHAVYLTLEVNYAPFFRKRLGSLSGGGAQAVIQKLLERQKILSSSAEISDSTSGSGFQPSSGDGTR